MKYSTITGYGFGLRYKPDGCPYIRIAINRLRADGTHRESVYNDPTRSSQNRFTAAIHAEALRNQAKKERRKYITSFRPEVYELWCRNVLQDGSI